MKTEEKVGKLQELLKKLEFDAFLVPSGDAHASEYIAATDARRAFISGFTGSAGYAVVTRDQAALWTDGRYFLQAEKQLGRCFKLMKDGIEGTPSRPSWLSSVLPAGSKIAFDPRLTSIDELKTLKKSLKNMQLVSVFDNLVDQIWENKPLRPAFPLLVLDSKYSGQAHYEKIQNLRKWMQDYKSVDGVEGEAEEENKNTKVGGFLATALDEVCWLLNLRGSDIPFNPVFFAYYLVTPTRNILFTDKSRIDSSVEKHLNHSNTEIYEYDQIFTELKKFASSLTETEGCVSKLLVGETGNVAVVEALGDEKLVKVVKSPIQKAKAIKNETELEGFRQCHKRDAAALCNFFGWLEHELIVKGNSHLSEVDAADQAEKFRSKQADFMGLSFDTISSTGPNGAIIHYKPEKGSCAIIDKSKVYLCDSGGQYKDGTTDVTRTLHFTQPSEFEKLAFTRVLQGHIALDTAVFPVGTTGYILDPFARAPLWKSGLNYRHGTGHGVGSFLNVHEGPQGIGLRKAYDNVALEPGMTLTDEPGYYHDGSFGVRIENVLIVKEVETKEMFGGKKYLGFEHVTFVPIGKNMIEKGLLSADEISWLNSYHLKCREKILPLLEKESLGYKWLLKETEPL